MLELRTCKVHVYWELW